MNLRKTKRKAVGILLSLCLMFGSVGMAYGATSVSSDVKGHWAESQISDWTSKGLIKGYEDGSFKPDNSITRGEFFALVNRSFGFTAIAPVSFSDLNVSDWEYTDVQEALSAGYIKGYEDQTIRTGNKISRQEMAMIVLRLLGLTEYADKADIFTDASTIPSWSKGAIGAVQLKGIIQGYEDNSFRPLNSTTRAEAVVMLDRALQNRDTNTISTIYDTAGTFGPVAGTTTINGNVMISVPGVILQNTVITGNLIFAKGINTGDATLKNVTVKGTTSVQGGGENSIHLINSTLATLIVEKADNSTVRIVAEGTTTVDQVNVKSAVTLEELNETGTGFTNVTLTADLPDGSKVTLKGTFGTLDIIGNNLNVELASGSIQQITVETQA
ncbi:MAG: hypothetical protein JWM44_2775, partial [Bacilli bacterium]|nr:hypothetical protein [Bacilli bacterium]